MVGLPHEARLSDLGLTGCYMGTLNPIPQSSEIRLPITHNNEIFETVGRVVLCQHVSGNGRYVHRACPRNNENGWCGACKIAISSFDFRAAAKVSEFPGKIK
jgi:hypothetical protein